MLQKMRILLISEHFKVKKETKTGKYKFLVSKLTDILINAYHSAIMEMLDPNFVHFILCGHKI